MFIRNVIVPGGYWTTWGEWGACPSTCGVSEAIRERPCFDKYGSCTSGEPTDTKYCIFADCVGEGN